MIKFDALEFIVKIIKRCFISEEKSMWRGECEY